MQSSNLEMAMGGQESDVVYLIVRDYVHGRQDEPFVSVSCGREMMRRAPTWLSKGCQDPIRVES